VTCRARRRVNGCTSPARILGLSALGATRPREHTGGAVGGDAGRGGGARRATGREHSGNGRCSGRCPTCGGSRRSAGSSAALAAAPGGAWAAP